MGVLTDLLRDDIERLTDERDEALAEVERLRELVERAEPFVRDSLNFTGSPWCGSDDARRWLIDAATHES